jgi:hypothetical protein
LTHLWLLLALAGCWFGDPISYTAIQAYAPDKTKEESTRTLDEVMTAVGARRVKGYTAGYLIEGRVMSYADYEREFCDIGSEEDCRRCMSVFGELAVPQHTDEVRTGDETKITFDMPGSHASTEAKIARQNAGSIVCIEFVAFNVSEFDAIARARIDQVKAVVIDRFGKANVVGAPCHSGSDIRSWPE